MTLPHHIYKNPSATLKSLTSHHISFSNLSIGVPPRTSKHGKTREPVLSPLLCSSHVCHRLSCWWRLWEWPPKPDKWLQDIRDVPSESKGSSFGCLLWCHQEGKRFLLVLQGHQRNREGCVHGEGCVCCWAVQEAIWAWLPVRKWVFFCVHLHKCSVDYCDLLYALVLLSVNRISVN